MQSFLFCHLPVVYDGNTVRLLPGRIGVFNPEGSQVCVGAAGCLRSVSELRAVIVEIGNHVSTCTFGMSQVMRASVERGKCGCSCSKSGPPNRAQVRGPLHERRLLPPSQRLFPS